MAAMAAVPLIVLTIGAWVLSGPPTRLALRLYDDAYYYFGVARSLASGAGSTFDGIHATNGYHPLWAWMLVPVLRVFDDPDTGVRAAGALWFLLAAASTVAIAWAVRPRSGAAGAAVAAAVFGLHPFLGLALERPNGLETPLYALAVAVAIGLFERAGGEPSWISTVAVGFAAGFAALARLDGAFLAVAIATLYLLRRGATGRIRRAALVGGIAAAMIAPFLLWNTVRFDSPMPVSGRIVSLGAAKEREALGGVGSPAFWKRRAAYAVHDIPGAVARVGVERIPGSEPLRRGVLPALLLMAFWLSAVGWGLHRRNAGGTISSDALAALTLFALLHYAAYAFWLWTGGEVRYRLYYFLPQWMTFAAGVGACVGRGRSRANRGWVAVAGTVILAVHTGLAVRDRDAYQDVSDRPLTQSFVYGWVRQHLPDGAVLGARDAGKLGWFSGRKVVNLDGLINDQELVAAIREGREADYVFASSIDYLFYSPSVLEESAPVTQMLRSLDERPDCDLRRLPGDTGGWAVFRITRPDR